MHAVNVLLDEPLIFVVVNTLEETTKTSQSELWENIDRSIMSYVDISVF